jgi:hypothetical protein
MKKTAITALFFCLCLKPALAQQQKDIKKLTDSVETEGKALYLSEIASWYGTDIFLEQCKNKKGRIGGYLSYDTGKGVNNIFFSKDAEPVVLATMSFPYEVKPPNCKLDTAERKLSPTENQLYRIRKSAMLAINSNKDSIFRFYKNTGTNPVPIVINGQKRVYFLTSPHANGVVIFGNDYLLTFDKNDQVATTKRLHKNIISIPIGRNPADTSKSETVAGMHTHVAETGEFITATDICTLMLYEKFSSWKQYYVISPTYVSIWDCAKNSLVALTREAWDKINADQKARHPSN